MSGQDLAQQDVVEKYEAIEDAHYEERKEAHLERLRDAEADTEEYSIEYENQVQASKQRDEILKTVISAFLPNSTLSSETGWEFKVVLPLEEMEVESPDIILGNPETGGIILVNCLPERERPTNTITRLQNATQAVQSNRHTFSEEVGLDINEDLIECAVCVPEKSDRRTGEALEELESEGRIHVRTSIWRVDGPESERLDLFTVSEALADGGYPEDSTLSQILRDGWEVAKQMHALPDFFPLTHHQLIAEHTVGEMVQKRLRDGIAKSHFSDEELELYLRQTLSYSGAGDIAEQRTSELLYRWVHMGIIDSLTPSQTDLEQGSSFYRFDVDSRGAGNIMKEVKSQYSRLAIEHRLEIEAMRATLDEFDEQQRSLTDFD